MKLKKTTLSLSAMVLIGALSAPAFAEDAEDAKDKKRDDPTYSAIRLTSVSTDFDNLGSAVNLGFTIGIKIPKLSFLAAEIDLSSTLIPGENSGSGGVIGGGNGNGSGSCDPASELLGLCTPNEGGGNGGGSANNTSDGDDLRLNTVGIFATGRTPGNFYATGRVGYRFVESTIDELNEEQTGSAWGVGAGYRYSAKGLVELTYTQYGSDLSYLSLVVAY